MTLRAWPDSDKMLFKAVAQVDSVSETKKSSATLLFWEKKRKNLEIGIQSEKSGRNDTVLPEKQ